MIKIRTYLVAGLLAMTGAVSAQNETDAFRYSGMGIAGTARAVGMGGAFSAVGADYTSAYLNPAGLAFYRRGELSVTTHLRFTGTESNYLGQSTNGSNTNFGFSSLGYVFSDKVRSFDRAGQEKKGGMVNYSIALGFNQQDYYHRTTRASAYNGENSITDWLATQAQGYDIDQLWDGSGYASQALNAGLIDTTGGSNYDYIGAAIGGEVQQDLEITERGRQNEWNLGVAANIDHFLYVGAVVGIRDVRFWQEFYMVEEDVNDVHNTWANDSTPLQRAYFDDYFRTKGTGINARVGVIVRPTDFIRVGVSVQSPTWYGLTDRYISEINSEFDGDPNLYGTEGLEGSFRYNLSTPWKLTAGAMLLFGKMGFISADFDMTDYSASTLSSDASSGYYYSFTNENKAIRDMSGTAYNFRFGGELRAGEYRIRAGYANYGSILSDEFLRYYDYESGAVKSVNGNRQYITGGLGIKRENYYIDLAYARDMRESRKLVYTLADASAYSPELIQKINTNNFLLTIGFTF